MWPRFSLASAGAQAAVLVFFWVLYYTPNILTDQLIALSFLLITISALGLWLIFTAPFVLWVWYIATQSILVFSYESIFKPGLKIAFDATVLKALAFFLICLQASILLRPVAFWQGLKIACYWGPVLTWLGYPPFSNPTINAGFLVLCLAARPNIAGWGLVISVVLAQKGTTPYLVLAAMILWEAEFLWHWLFVILAGGILTGLKFITHGVTYGSSRFDTFREIFRFGWPDSSLWLGAGFHGFEIFGPLMQRVTGYGLGAQEIWLTMHSDWLQVFFEFGLIGTIIFVLVILSAVLSGDRKTSGFLIGLLAFGFLNFPLQVPAIFFCFVFVLTNASRRQGCIIIRQGDAWQNF